jgi:hypothetical protein
VAERRRDWAILFMASLAVVVPLVVSRHPGAWTWPYDLSVGIGALGALSAFVGLFLGPLMLNVWHQVTGHPLPNAKVERIGDSWWLTLENLYWVSTNEVRCEVYEPHGWFRHPSGQIVEMEFGTRGNPVNRSVSLSASFPDDFPTASNFSSDWKTLRVVWKEVSFQQFGMPPSGYKTVARSRIAR